MAPREAGKLRNPGRLNYSVASHFKEIGGMNQLPLAFPE